MTGWKLSMDNINQIKCWDTLKHQNSNPSNNNSNSKYMAYNKTEYTPV